MATLPELLLKQYGGMSKGVYRTVPIDNIYVKVGERFKLIARCGRRPEGVVQFIHFMPDAELAKAVRDRVAELREESGGFSVSHRVTFPPNPRIIQGYLKGERYRERPTTIVMPDGTPASEPEPESMAETLETDWSDDDSDD